MYLSFYGLKEKPFNATPDPKFLCLTPGHREALAQLVYSVQENRGFLVLTGEVGTGKTTLLQAFLQRLNGKAVVAYVLDSTLPFEGLLECMLEELGVPTAASSPAQRLLALRRFMLDRRRAGHNTVLVVDEAQNLDTAALEKIRMLSNFETPTEKLLQILLVGQPELRVKLNRPELRQLQQRIELRCSLPPLSREQVRDYILTRLRIAGAHDLGLFSEQAQTRIAVHSRGIPRRVNILCDHCLVLGYADQRRLIEVDVVDQAIEALRKGANLQVVAVTSPGIGDGKTTTAINLAGALAQSASARVLLVDMALRRHAVERRLGLGGSKRAVVDALLDSGLTLGDTVEPLAYFNLSVLPAGKPAIAPYELLKSPRLEALLDEARQRYDYIVLDTPPFVPVPDCRGIAKYVDGFLTVVAAHRTPRSALAQALDLMDPGKVAGLVFNGDDTRRSSYYSAYVGSPRGARWRWPWRKP